MSWTKKREGGGAGARAAHEPQRRLAPDDRQEEKLGLRRPPSPAPLTRDGWHLPTGKKLGPRHRPHRHRLWHQPQSGRPVCPGRCRLWHVALHQSMACVPPSVCGMRPSISPYGMWPSISALRRLIRSLLIPNRSISLNLARHRSRSSLCRPGPQKPRSCQGAGGTRREKGSLEGRQDQGEECLEFGSGGAPVRFIPSVFP